jgi:Fungal trichothecene efflux pump (TRI12)
VFTDHVTWRWCFYINLPIGGVTIIGIALFLQNPERLENNKTVRERLKQLDFFGAFFLIPGVVCLLLALQWGGTQYAWNSATIIGLFCGFGALIIVFIVVQLVLGERATIPTRIFTKRSVFFSAMFSFCVGSAFMIIIFYIPIYFQGVKGTSATGSGVHTLPLLLSVVFASVIGGGLVTVIGYYTPFMIVGQALFAIGAGLLSTLSVNSSTGEWFGYQVIAGVGIGMSLQVFLPS